MGVVCERVEGEALGEVLDEVLDQAHVIPGVEPLESDPIAPEHYIIGIVCAEEESESRDDSQCQCQQGPG